MIAKIDVPLYDEPNQLRWKRVDEAKIFCGGGFLQYSVVALIEHKDEDGLGVWEESQFVEVWKYRLDKIFQIGMSYSQKIDMWYVILDVPGSTSTFFPSMAEAKAWYELMDAIIFNFDNENKIKIAIFNYEQEREHGLVSEGSL